MSDSVHAGHRERLRERYLREGIDSIEPHHVLELLLFYAIPRRDTNEIAHRLLARFGNLSGIFNATVEELCKVEGISRGTATFLHLIPDVYRTSLVQTDPCIRCDSMDKLAALMQKYYLGVQVEIVYLVLLDNSKRIIRVEKVCEGSVNSVALDIRKMIEIALHGNAASVILVHNHPHGLPIPSSSDIETTHRVHAAFQLMNIPLTEHLLIAGDRYHVISANMPGVFMAKV